MLTYAFSFDWMGCDSRRLPGGVALGLCLAVVLLAGDARAEDRVPGEGRVINLTMPIDGKMSAGVIVAYSPMHFTLEAASGEQHQVLWSMLPADRVDRYWRFLEAIDQNDPDPTKLLELGSILIKHTQGQALADQAFDQALAVDPALEQAVEAARQGREPDGRPRLVGRALAERWGTLSPQEMDRANQAIRDVTKLIEQRLGLGLRLYESERFAVLTDIDPERVALLAEALTQAYRATAQVLGDDPDANVFLGKCLVVIFDRRVDYIRYQQLMHATDARGTSGLCHRFGDGHVRVAVVSRRTERQTHHVLTHEFVHAYLHRYRSPTPLPDWVDEGLATHLAHALVPPPGENPRLKSRFLLEGQRGLGDSFFDDDANLDAWQYDVAGSLTGYLIDRSRPAYPRFIQAIKADTPATEALDSVYRLTPAKLTLRFKRELDRELNRTLGQ